MMDPAVVVERRLAQKPVPAAIGTCCPVPAHSYVEGEQLRTLE